MTIPRVSITIDPGGNSGGGGVSPFPPHGDLYWYADVLGSFALGDVLADGTEILAWGNAAAVGTPLLVVDSVTGQLAVRTTPSNTLTTSAGVTDFLVSGASTAFFVCRMTHYNPGGDFTIASSTASGTLKGFEATVYDKNSDIFQFRVISPRIYDGASYVVDTPGSQTAGYYLTQRWHIVCLRLTSTSLEVIVDGRASRRIPLPISWSYLAPGSGPFVIGGGHVDHLAIELYQTAQTDEEVAASFRRLAARFGTSLIVPIAGDVYTTAAFYGFPNLLTAPGKLYLTYFQGIDESPRATNTQHAVESLNGGATWINDTVIQASDSSTSYADIATLIMSNGNWLQTTYLYTLPGGSITHLAARTSTDAGVSWSSWRNVSLGSHSDPASFQATGAPPVESAITPGRIIWPCYTLEDGATKGDAYVYLSTDFGDTFPTRVRAAHGDADGCDYQEPGIIVESGYLYMLVRRANGATTMGQLRSTDDAASWSAVADTTMAATSAARGLLKDTAGTYRWAGGRPNNIQEAALYSRAAGAAWDAVWNNVPVAPWLDPLYGGSAYGGITQTGTNPVEYTAVWGANTDPTHDDIVARTHLQAWLFTNPPSMPGAVTPSSATLSVTDTLQLYVTGAGGFTYSVSGSTGTSCDSLGLVTAGSVNGAAVITVRDQNNVIVATCDVTVTGATSNPNITAIWPDAGTALGGTAVIIIGANFTGQTSVTLGGTACTSVVVVDDNTITAVTPAHAALLNATVAVGSGSLVNGFCFLPDTLIRHYDAATLPAGIVTTIVDLMGHENLTQSSSGNRPTCNLTGINNKPSITNTTSTGLIGGSTSWATTAITVGALFQTTQVTNGRIYDMRYNTDHYSIEIENSTGKFVYQTADSTTAKSNSAVNDGTPHAGIATLNTAGDGTARVYVDSTTPATTTAASTTPINWDDAAGDRNAAGTSSHDGGGDIFATFVGSYAVLLGFTTALTGSDLTIVMGYLKRRGGIA